MRGKQVTVGHRLYSWPEYAAVARAVRYETLFFDDVMPYFEELGRRFGQAKVQAAVNDVCQLNRDATPVTVHLKPEVRRQCFGLLGPTPEQEDEYYRHPDGSPQERPPRKEPDAVAFRREHRPARTAPAEPPEPVKAVRSRRARRVTGYQAVAAAVADGPAVSAQAQAAGRPHPLSDPRPLEERVRDMGGAELTQNYFRAKAILAAGDPAARHFGLAKDAFPFLEAECRRRGYNLPPPHAGEPDAAEQAMARPPVAGKDAADGHAYVVEKLRAELKQLKGSLRSFPKRSPNRSFLLDQVRRVREQLDLERDGDRETGVPSVGDLKRRYRALMQSFQALPDASPAKAEIKAELQKLRAEIRQAGGGVVF